MRSAARRGTAVLLVLAGALGGCHRHLAAPVEARYRVAQRGALETAGYPGLSGLTVAEDGLWAVPEGGAALLPLRFDGTAAALRGAPVPLEGVPAGLDTESIAALGGGRFAIGTESHAPARASDAILMARVDGGRARVIASRPLDYAPFGLRADPNCGIEGLCAAAGVLVAAVETRGDDGTLYAPIARIDAPLDAAIGAPLGATAGAWNLASPVAAFRLRMTSDRGKISALACRPVAGEDALEVLAIERHFGVSRLLSFRLPIDGPGGDLRPRVLIDLATQLDPLPNLEGLAFLDGDRVLALSDNQYGRITGPTEFVLLTPIHNP